MLAILAEWWWVVGWWEVGGGRWAVVCAGERWFLVGGFGRWILGGGLWSMSGGLRPVGLQVSHQVVEGLAGWAV